MIYRFAVRFWRTGGDEGEVSVEDIAATLTTEATDEDEVVIHAETEHETVNVYLTSEEACQFAVRLIAAAHSGAS